MASERLVCVRCGASYSDSERFCPQCRLPLSCGDERSPTSDVHARARKVKPQLAEGELVRVAGARNQAEGEFIQGLLLEEGVPSILRRSRGFDVPDFLAAGPRDVLVPAAGASTALEVLLQSELLHPDERPPPVAAGRLLFGLLVALGVGALVVWLLSEVL